MNKTSLDEVIAKRAEKRFEREWEELLGVISKHPIGSLLRVTVNNATLKLAINYRGGTPTLALLDPYQSKSVTKNTNFAEIKDRLLKEYRDQELNLVLDRLDGLDYLFNQANQ